MATRQDFINHFIKKHHLQDIEWLATDASTRRYARVCKKNKTYILMDSPLSEKPKEFVLIDKILRKNGISAPKIYAKDLRHGLILLEDFGSLLMSQAVQQKKKRDRIKFIYEYCCEKIDSYNEGKNICEFD